MLDIFECVNDNALKSVVASYFIQLTGNSEDLRNKLQDRRCCRHDEDCLRRCLYYTATAFFCLQGRGYPYDVYTGQ